MTYSKHGKRLFLFSDNYGMTHVKQCEKKGIVLLKLLNIVSG